MTCACACQGVGVVSTCQHSSIKRFENVVRVSTLALEEVLVTDQRRTEATGGAILSH